MPISAEDFRAGMRQLAAAVNVITTEHDGQRAGMTATAVMSVTAEPPQLAVAVNKSNASFTAITQSSVFAVNVLPHDHADLAGNFAGAAKGDDRFATAAWGQLTTGAPVLLDSAAVFDCRVVKAIEFETHVLFVGLVEAIRVVPTTTPLLYMDGTWASLVRAGASDFQAYEIVVAQIADGMNAALADNKSPRAQLKAFSRTFAVVSFEARDVLRDFFSKETFVPADRLDRINRQKRDVEQKLQSLLDRGVDAGDFDLPDTGVTADAIIGMLNSLHRTQVAGEAITAGEIGQRFTDLVDAMVGPRAESKAP